MSRPSAPEIHVSSRLPEAPDVIGNRNFYSAYDWSRGGEEWSEDWGGSDGLWFATLYPRLRAFLPKGHVLEIGCGCGRVTHYLRAWAERMTVVDVVERCVERCRERFAAGGGGHIAYAVNDGVSLDMVEDGSVDLAVSWETLVYAEHATVRAYLKELAAKLRRGGAAFIHHSNLGEHGDAQAAGGALTVGRRTSTSAEKVRGDCAEFGLRCVSQEIFSANDSGYWTDCITLCVRDGVGGGDAGAAARVERRHDWALEKANARRMMEMYRRPREIG